MYKVLSYVLFYLGSFYLYLAVINDKPDWYFWSITSLLVVTFFTNFILEESVVMDIKEKTKNRVDKSEEDRIAFQNFCYIELKKRPWDASHTSLLFYTILSICVWLLAISVVAWAFI